MGTENLEHSSSEPQPSQLEQFRVVHPATGLLMQEQEQGPGAGAALDLLKREAGQTGAASECGRRAAGGSGLTRIQTHTTLRRLIGAEPEPEGLPTASVTKAKRPAKRTAAVW
ncbi:hypothetical protein GCM10009616_08150 [Microlunatus lacustris]